MDKTFTPGSPAYLEGQRVGALGQEPKHNAQQEPGCNDSPGEPGSRIQVITIAIGNKPTWVLFQGNAN